MIVVWRVLACCALPALFALPSVAAAECGSKRYCGQMANCAEAVHYLKKCRLRRLDGDGDGIPCETLCGKTMEALQRRLSLQTGNRLWAPVLECAGKRTCSDMNDCREARFYLDQCGLSSLDRDGDGVPCEGLCR